MWVAIEATTLASAPLLYFNRNAALARGDLEVPARRLGRDRARAARARSSSPTPRSARGSTRRCSSRTWSRDAPQLSQPWLHVGVRAAARRLRHQDGPRADAHLEARRLRRGARAWSARCSPAGSRTAPSSRSCASSRSAARPARRRSRAQLLLVIGLLSMAVAGVVHGAAARLQAHARLLERRAHGHPGARARASAAPAIFGALLHLVNNGLTKGVLFLSAGNIHRAYGSKLTDEVSRRDAPGAALGRALPGRLLRDHRLAAVRAVPERVHDPARARSTAGSYCVAAAVPRCCCSSCSSAWARRCCRVVQGEPPTRGRAHALPRRLPRRSARRSRAPGAGARCSGSTSRRRSTRCCTRRRRFLEARPMSANAACLALAQRRARVPRDAVPRLALDDVPSARDRRAAARAGASPRCSACRRSTTRSSCVAVLGRRRRRARSRSAARRLRGGRVPVADARLPAGAPVRARDRRAVGRRARGPSVAQAGALPPLDAPGTTPGRPDGEAPTIGVTDFYRVEGEEVHEVAVGPGPRRRHRARALPLPVPRRARLPPRDLARLPAPRRRARARRRADKRSIHYVETLAGDTTIGHATAYCQVLEALARSASAAARARAARRSRSSSSAWRTTPATSARWPATSASCRRRRTAAGCAATS